MNAAGIVAQHPADATMRVGGGIWTEDEVMFLGFFLQIIQHTTRLHARQFSLRIDLEDVVEMFGKIHHHRHITTLAGQTGAAAPRKERSTGTATLLDCYHHILNCSREDY